MSWFYNLRISNKLRLSFGVLLVLMIGIGYSGYFGMMNIIPNFDSMYKDRLVPSIQFYRMLKNVNEIRLQAIRHINTNDSSEMQRIEEIIKVLQSDFNKNLEEYAATYLVREEVENLAKLRKDLIQFNNALAKELTASRALLREDALKLHLGEFSDKTVAVTQTMNALVDVQDTVGKELYSDSEITVQQQKIVILSIILMGLLFTVILSWIITRAIGTPMRALQDAASDIANGNTAIHIQAQYKDEIGMLGRAFITMANNLDKLFHDIRQKSAQAEEAAEQAEKARRQALEQQEYLSRKVDEILVQMESLAIGDLTARLPLEQGVRGNDSLSRLFEGFNATVNSIRELVSQLISATHQTGMVSVSMSSLAEEISAIVEEQSAQTTSISDSTNRMAQSIRTNSHNAASVKDVTQELSRHVINLDASSNKINAISRSIGDIAFQINLLSLNASIEAARAGRAGKGFAVVAAEVKNLAQSTARSTNEIKTIVEEIQMRIHEIATMTLEQAKNSSGSARRNVVEMVSEISATMEEQSTASAEIAQNTQQISLAAQQTAISVGHITRTAEELTQLTEKLQNLVGKFILEKETNSHASSLQRRNNLFLS